MRPILVAKKIAKGINIKYGTRIVINTSEFYGDNHNLVRMYEIKDAYYGANGEPVNKRLFRSASGVYTVLFMRDLMLKIQGEDLPPDEEDPGWAATREKKGAFQSFDYILENYVLKDKIVEEADYE